MPVYRYPTAPGELERAIDTLERTDEIIDVVLQGDAVIIFTRRPKRATKETR